VLLAAAAAAAAAGCLFEIKFERGKGFSGGNRLLR
jgi:hypothetical protein